ncbi:trans-aconitate methyltransferase 1 [Paramarasmius palmivorus]|uniref:Trans-aconitate methyltransferase 1 n=1 Tax=Paramarasmius palmivorus TaxID=297713 RepID=A0AAW0EED7_9AGAR
MATFAKASFDSAIYAASRPRYPKALFELIYKYHQEGPAALPLASQGSYTLKGRPRFDTAVDLGCGTGQATAELTQFKKVIGVEPSAGMVENARKYVVERFGSGETNLDATSEQFEFVQSPAENLGFLGDNSVDLVIAAQAAHWFDWNKMWPELARVLRANGTVAFWVYSEFRLPQYPSLTPLITEYSQGSDPDNSLGPHWQRPGRTILEDHLVDVPAPKDVSGSEKAFSDTSRIFFTGKFILPKSTPLADTSGHSPVEDNLEWPTWLL